MSITRLQGYVLAITYVLIGLFASNQALAQNDILVLKQTLSIQDAVTIALANNPSVAIKTADAEAAKSRIGMAKSMTKPRLSTTTFGTTGTMSNIIPGPASVDPQGMVIVPDKGQIDQNLMAMYPLYTGGRLSGQVRGARGQYQAAASDSTTAKLDVALEAKTAYRRVLLAGRFVEAYKKRTDESKERVRIAEAAFTEGRIAKYDLLRNQTELAEAEQQLVNAQRDADIALVDLKSAMGVSQSSEITLSDQLAFQPAQIALADLESRSLQQRPEVAAVKARLKAAEAGVGVAKSSYKPQIYAIGMQDFVTSSGNGFDNGFTVGIAASLPIIDGGQRKSTVNEAKAMLRRMQAEEREVVLMVSRNVATAWAELQAASKNVGLAQAAVDQAEEDYRVIKLRYEAGKATNVEVLDALASMTRAETNYAQALFEHNVAQDRLERAVGNNTLGGK
ncbi:MAG: TolC family protein [Armatimonadota bacterium]|nr:TolC family protein [Armatimonadota bacterium]